MVLAVVSSIIGHATVNTENAPMTISHKMYSDLLRRLQTTAVVEREKLPIWESWRRAKCEKADEWDICTPLQDSSRIRGHFSYCINWRRTTKMLEAWKYWKHHHLRALMCTTDGILKHISPMMVLNYWNGWDDGWNNSRNINNCKRKEAQKGVFCVQ